MLVLDKGEVKLLNFMGGDLAVVASARVSTGVTLDDASKGEESDQKLINYLMKHRHGTPFEHSVFTFYIKCPIFVAREWMRHRIGSFNEISGRYVEFKPEFYIPEEYRIPAPTNKQGSVFPEDSWFDTNIGFWVWTKEENPSKVWNRANKNVIKEVSENAYNSYKLLISYGTAKEMARMVLPLNLYTQFYWTVNARALMNFLNLRCAEDAQWEIRQYALAIRKLFEGKMRYTFKAWEQNNYLAP